MTGKSSSITNCYHFSSPSAAFSSSTFPPSPPFYFTSGCRCDGKESAAGEFWSAPNNGLIYLTSPPPRLSPLKIINTSAFHGSLAFRLWDRRFISSFSQTLFLSSGGRTRSFCLAPPLALAECLIPSTCKLTKSHKSHTLVWVRWWSALHSSASLWFLLLHFNHFRHSHASQSGLVPQLRVQSVRGSGQRGFPKSTADSSSGLQLWEDTLVAAHRAALRWL